MAEPTAEERAERNDDKPDVPEWLVDVLDAWTALPGGRHLGRLMEMVAAHPEFIAQREKAEALDWLGTSQGFAGHPDIEWLAPADEENLPNGGWAVYFDHPSKTAYGGTPVEAIQRARAQEPTERAPMADPKPDVPKWLTLLLPCQDSFVVPPLEPCTERGVAADAICEQCRDRESIAAHPEFIAMREAAEALTALADGAVLIVKGDDGSWVARHRDRDGFDIESWCAPTNLLAAIQRARAQESTDG